MEKKKNIGLYCEGQTLDEIDAALEQADCRSRNEFIRKAIGFYLAYLHAGSDSAVLLPAVDQLLSDKLRDHENRLSHAFFKLGVETAIMSHVVAGTHKISDENLAAVREFCEEEVARLSGRYSFESAVKYQR